MANYDVTVADRPISRECSLLISYSIEEPMSGHILGDVVPDALPKWFDIRDQTRSHIVMKGEDRIPATTPISTLDHIRDVYMLDKVEYEGLETAEAKFMSKNDVHGSIWSISEGQSAEVIIETGFANRIREEKFKEEWIDHALEHESLSGLFPNYTRISEDEYTFGTFGNNRNDIDVDMLRTALNNFEDDFEVENQMMSCKPV